MAMAMCDQVAVAVAYMMHTYIYINPRTELCKMKAQCKFIYEKSNKCKWVGVRGKRDRIAVKPLEESKQQGKRKKGRVIVV